MLCLTTALRFNPIEVVKLATSYTDWIWSAWQVLFINGCGLFSLGFFGTMQQEGLYDFAITMAVLAKVEQQKEPSAHSSLRGMS